MMKKKSSLPIGKWNAVKLAGTDQTYDFEPGEWMLEFLPDDRMTIYLEGDPIGEYDCTLEGDQLTIDGGIAKKIELSDTLLIVHETSYEDGTPCHTIYMRTHGDEAHLPK